MAKEATARRRKGPSLPCIALRFRNEESLAIDCQAFLLPCTYRVLTKFIGRLSTMGAEGFEPPTPWV